MALDFDKVKADSFDDLDTDGFGGNNSGFWGNLMSGVKAGANIYGQHQQMQLQQKMVAEDYIIDRIDRVMNNVDVWDNESVTKATEVMDRIGSSKGNWANMPRVSEYYQTKRQQLIGGIENRKSHVEMINEIQNDGPGGMYHPEHFITDGGGKWANLKGDELLQKWDEAVSYYNSKLVDAGKLIQNPSILQATREVIGDKIIQLENDKSYWGASGDFTQSEYIKSSGGRKLSEAYDDQTSLVYNKQQRLQILTREIDRLEETERGSNTTDAMWDTRNTNLATFKAEKQVLLSELPGLIGEQSSLKYEMDGEGSGAKATFNPLGIVIDDAENKLKKQNINNQLTKISTTVPDTNIVVPDTSIVDTNTTDSDILVFNDKTGLYENKQLTDYEKQVKKQIQANILGSTEPTDDDSTLTDANIVKKQGYIDHKSFDAFEKEIDEEIASEINEDNLKVGEYGRTSRNFRYGLSKKTKKKLEKKYSKRFVNKLQQYYTLKERKGAKPEHIAKAKEQFLKYYESFFEMADKKLKNMSKEELEQYIKSMD